MALNPVRGIRAGYGLLRAASESGVQLGQVGGNWSGKGTLAIVLEAVLRTVPLPAAQEVVVLPFIGLSDAASFVPELLGPALGASSCDRFDRHGRSVWLEQMPTFHAAAGSMRRPRRS